MGKIIFKEVAKIVIVAVKKLLSSWYGGGHGDSLKKLFSSDKYCCDCQ